MPKETITVQITCEQKVTYKQDVEMTIEDYEALLAVSDDDVTEADHPKEYNILFDSLDGKDIYDWEHEFLFVQVEKRE